MRQVFPTVVLSGEVGLEGRCWKHCAVISHHDRPIGASITRVETLVFESEYKIHHHNAGVTKKCVGHGFSHPSSIRSS